MGLGNDCLDVTPKASEIHQNKQVKLQTEKLLHNKRNDQQNKMTLQNRKKISAIHISDKGLNLKYTNNSHNSIAKPK